MFIHTEQHCNNRIDRIFVVGVSCFSVVHLCITVYLALKVFKLEAVIDTTPTGSQILLEHCRNSTHICPDNESRDSKCSEAPLIQNSAKHMFATNKTNLLIPCHVTGYPLPYITWTVNGSKISNNDKFLVRADGLLIQRVTYTDHGSYTCTTRNIVGKKTEQ
ncbi:Hypothetical predicted protein [Mytilus galloprovincialis]|uniref:Ig-like domain-containing protein n=1 Tax=Mytilus galloprovincialis TaxID=29158 RepID=A0A8B6G968_MYTGA|nr:Hypothetical predicted protein [Mytilus galloprovincialis]